MSFHLDQLPHQSDAIQAVLQAMQGCRDFNERQYADYNYVYANPIIRLQHSALSATKLPQSLGGNGIDIKMETGTGKTYVYTRLMLELYKQFGINKFVLFVPSLPIKEGTKSFITADYARQHFAPYGTKIDLCTINAGSFTTKKGRRTMSADLVEYLEGSRNDRNTIKCLLLNDAMLMSKSMTRDDYDQTLIGSTNCPVEGIKQTRPVVIIDEPHRFKKEGKAYQAIKALDPQLIIRFGATFPEITIGSGKNKVVKKDYENLVYNLGSVQAFNDGLVKGVDIYYPEIGEEAVKETAQYKVVEIKSTGDKYVRFKRIGTDKTYDLKVNESLSVVDEAFEGDVELYEIKNADFAVLSNELELHKGTVLIPQIYSASYQEIMIRQAIDKHFAKERENWFRASSGANAPRIKTLSLFFIDSIESYRSKDGWLKNVFETALNEKLRELIKGEADAEYKDFLEQSLHDIGATHGGYFAEDAGSSEEKLQEEIDDILRNKEKMTQFTDEHGAWNTRRFLFSKWTLREGWDNPNVFVITKLRTSGSEISKLQEVGRGLRLPVDERGKRLSAEEFRLDYIIDWTERDFARLLVSEINGDSGLSGKVKPEIFEALVAAGYAATPDKAKATLVINDIIDDDGNILNQEALVSLLPEISVQKNKVTTNGDTRAPKVALRKENWEKIKDIWGDVTKRYMLEFEHVDDDTLLNLLQNVFTLGNLVTARIAIRKGELIGTEDTMQVNDNVDFIETSVGELPYGEFLKRLARRTTVSVRLWHQAAVKNFAAGELKNELLNMQSLEVLVSKFQKTFEAYFAEKYTYSSLDYSANTSIMQNGTLVDEISQGAVGSTKATDITLSTRYLYEEVFYDTSIEHDVLTLDPPSKVIAYGKLPRKSIRVPTYTGGTTTPDFIYAIDKGGGKVELSLLVETKSTDMRMSEEIAVNAQEKLFGGIKNVKWRKVVNTEELGRIIESL